MLKFNKIDKPLEWLQTIMGLLAAILVASNLGSQFVFFAMCLFTIKDCIMLYWTHKKGLYGLFTNSVGYMFINVYGLYNWWPI